MKSINVAIQIEDLHNERSVRAWFSTSTDRVEIEGQVTSDELEMIQDIVAQVRQQPDLRPAEAPGDIAS